MMRGRNELANRSCQMAGWQFWKEFKWTKTTSGPPSTSQGTLEKRCAAFIAKLGVKLHLLAQRITPHPKDCQRWVTDRPTPELNDINKLFTVYGPHERDTPSLDRKTKALVDSSLKRVPCFFVYQGL